MVIAMESKITEDNVSSRRPSLSLQPFDQRIGIVTDHMYIAEQNLHGLYSEVFEALQRVLTDLDEGFMEYESTATSKDRVLVQFGSMRN